MNTLKFLNSFSFERSTFAATMSAIRSKFFENGICWTDDVKGNFQADQSFRVILYPKKDNIDFKNPIVKECNGTVFEYNNGWKLLALPQNAFCTNKISMKKLNDLYVSGAYDVYEVLDATIVTLYYYQNQWHMSSTKSYDVGPLEMCQGMTFMDAFCDLMNTKYKAFRFEDLNKEFSYTVALRHSSYHIFDETKHLANRTRYVPKPGVDMNSYIMVMAVTDTTTGQTMSKNVPGLPQQNPITLKDSSVHSLTNYARSAYSKYSKAYRLQNFKYKPLYGYILRAKNRSVPLEYSTIYIESELYKIIKCGLYKNNKLIVDGNLNQLIVNMSASHDRYEQFRIVFQQFEYKFQQLDNAIEALANDVIYRIVNNAMDQSDASNPIETIICNLVDRLQTEPDITAGIVKDMLYSKEYIHVLPFLIQ